MRTSRDYWTRKRYTVFGCTASLGDVERRRNELGPRATAEMCFQASRIGELLIDDALRLPFDVLDWSMYEYISF
jgi:hypothetical protein